MPERTIHRIILGPCAGHHFHGQADLEVVYHCWCGEQHGYFHSRKRLVNRAAFEYDPTMGWEIDRWFEWFDEKGETDA